MNASASPPCFISLSRLAKLSSRSRMTLLLRLKDGKLHPDALLDLGNGPPLPLFDPQKAALFQKKPGNRHPLL